jgi:predicted 2-oxoglutarate/Fe(II)-dependent dioxygenase YbiX
METYTYRQPAAGQPFVNLIEGVHQQGLTLDRFAGRYVVVCCFGSSQIAPGRVALDALRRHQRLFDDERASFLGIVLDARETALGEQQSGVHFVLDKGGVISRHCGAAPMDEIPLGRQYRVTWTIVDPGLRVLAHFATDENDAGCEAVFAFLSGLPDPAAPAPCEIPAPVLIIPRVFEADLCDRLIDLYETGDPHDSGYMVNNVEKFDHSFKKRRDYFVTDAAVNEILSKRVAQCVNPEIRKLFFMEITRMERYLVGCYDAEEQGHFRPHRDNGRKVTAHRRFALSVALNDDFEGGELMFPEYNRRRHKLPKGWGLVFPCAILHAVAPVAKGRRYAFLPFLYDEEGARIKARAHGALN